MKRLGSELAVVIFCLLLGVVAYLPLFKTGFFSMHDFQQVARLFEMNKGLLAGQFPVRWVPDLGFGYGYSLFNFYPPLVYYLGELFHVIGFGFIDSIKLVWLIALAGSAIAMYFLAKELYGKIAGLVASMFYLYAPYHAVDAYVRGALAELFSFVWLPLILLMVYKKRPVWAGILLGLLMITHNLIFLPFMVFFAVWALVFDRKSLIVSPIIAFALTAFFWLPSLAEKQFTLVDQTLIKNLAAYNIHFVCPSQLWNSLWGYGGSAAGCLDGMSFKIGKAHIILSLFALLLVFFRRSKIILVSLSLGLFSTFMTTQYSKFIWDQIPQLWYLQFPWRFLEFTTLFAAICVGGVIKVIPLNKWLKFGLAVIFILMLVPNFKYFVPQTYFPVSDKDLTSDLEIKWNVSASSFEYMPREMATHINELGNIWVNIDQSQVANYKYKVINGEFAPSREQFVPGRFALEGTSNSSSVLQFSTTYFPGWQVYLDQRQTSIDHNNPYNLITVLVPPGKHIITGKFENTTVRSVGNVVSALAVVGILIYAARRRKA